MIKAVIFDMDGVIVDSEPLYFEVDKLLLREYGIEVADADLQKYVGIANPVMCAESIEKYSLSCTLEEMLDRQTLHRNRLWETKAWEPIPGIPELLQDLKRNGLKIGLASSSSRHQIETVLTGLKLKQFFDAVAGFEDVSKSKPDPGVFLKAAELLDVSPADCLVIEDSENGTKAAKLAGMKCVGYQSPGSVALNLELADTVVRSISEIDYREF